MSAALVLIAVGAALALAAVRFARGAPPHSARKLAAGAAIAATVALLAARQVALAAAVGAVALALTRAALAEARATPRPGGRSAVRTAWLEMTLDHDGGEMEGVVLAGPFAGRALSTLGPADLDALAAALAGDADSLALLRAYMRRRGLDDAPQDETPRAAPPADGREMTRAEALDVLGLGPEASVADVRAAHKRLMKRVHPDLGGSDALAALINAAKARLDP